jgi:hypothetical protein
MKKRIYKINNKNLVTGNPNEVTENEILVKENNDGTVELSHRNNGTLETLGSGGSGGSSNIMYIKFPDGAPQEDIMVISKIASFVKSKTYNKDNPDVIKVTILPTSFATFVGSPLVNNIFAIAIQLDAPFIAMNGENITVKGYLEGSGQLEFLRTLEITEEQFYDLTLPTE